MLPPAQKFQRGASMLFIDRLAEYLAVDFRDGDRDRSAGIDGDGAHTEWEHGLISSIEPRTLLMRGLLETLQ